MKPRIAIIVTARPSYAKLKTVIAALVAQDADVHVLACASAVLERYGDVSKVIEQDFPQVPLSRHWTVVEGENLITSAKETGALINELSSVLSSLRPDACIVCADRHEVLAAAQAASYLHLRLVHLQGGERSGSIDDKIRDAITALADDHFVCTKRAAMRVYGLTGAHDRVWALGCPSIDLAKQALNDPPVTAKELGGAGAPIDLGQPFLIVLQHPVTSEADEAYAQMAATLAAVDRPAVVLWPGEDAGAGAMSKAIRERGGQCHTVRSLPPARFLRLLTQSACLIGNSSAGIREASYLGVPVVNIGTRQQGRERGPNVIDVPHVSHEIARAVDEQIAHGTYPSSGLYGRGDSGVRIAEVLCSQYVSHHPSQVG